MSDRLSRLEQLLVEHDQRREEIVKEITTEREARSHTALAVPDDGPRVVRRKKHLALLGAWIGTLAGGWAAVREFSGQNRAAIAGVVAGLAAGGSIATVVFPDNDGYRGREAAPVRSSPAPTAMNPVRPTPPPRPPTKPPTRAPRPAVPLPSPTEIPDLQIPTTPLPTGIMIDSPSVRIPPGRTRLPRPPKVTPPVQPPITPPGQTDTDDECLIKVHIGDLKFC